MKRTTNIKKKPNTKIQAVIAIVALAMASFVVMTLDGKFPKQTLLH
jgi:hypothetical protein